MGAVRTALAKELARLREEREAAAAEAERLANSALGFKAQATAADAAIAEIEAALAALPA